MRLAFPHIHTHGRVSCISSRQKSNATSGKSGELTTLARSFSSERRCAARKRRCSPRNRKGVTYANTHYRRCCVVESADSHTRERCVELCVAPILSGPWHCQARYQVQARAFESTLLDEADALSQTKLETFASVSLIRRSVNARVYVYAYLCMYLAEPGLNITAGVALSEIRSLANHQASK